MQLAVVAHIRHVYTNYDRLLKTATYHEARAAIEKPCLDLLAQWRSDDDDDPNAMEEILREVIVIDDDDDEEDDIIETPPTQYHSIRDDSVEIISSHAFADEVELHAIDYGDSNQAIDRDRAYSPELDRRAIMQYPGSGRYRDSQQQHQNGSTSFDRSDIHQLRWQEALYRRRKNSMSMLTDGPLMQETKTSTSHALQSEARAQRPYLKDQQRQLLDYGSGTGMLSRDPFHNKSSALPGDENTSSQVMGIIKQRVNEIPPRPRQVSKPRQEDLF